MYQQTVEPDDFDDLAHDGAGSSSKPFETASLSDDIAGVGHDRRRSSARIVSARNLQNDRLNGSGLMVRGATLCKMDDPKAGIKSNITVTSCLIALQRDVVKHAGKFHAKTSSCSSRNAGLDSITVRPKTYRNTQDLDEHIILSATTLNITQARCDLSCSEPDKCL